MKKMKTKYVVAGCCATEHILRYDEKKRDLVPVSKKNERWAFIYSKDNNETFSIGFVDVEKSLSLDEKIKNIKKTGKVIEFDRELATQLIDTVFKFEPVGIYLRLI